MQRGTLPVLIKKNYVFTANRNGTDGSVDDVSVNRKQRRIGRQSGNKQVGSGFNHFQDHLCVCVCACVRIFPHLSIKLENLQGEQMRRTWVKVVSVATAAL